LGTNIHQERKAEVNADFKAALSAALHAMSFHEHESSLDHIPPYAGLANRFFPSYTHHPLTPGVASALTLWHWSRGGEKLHLGAGVCQSPGFCHILLPHAQDDIIGWPALTGRKGRVGIYPMEAKMAFCHRMRTGVGMM
jgi:hypothetical protein